MHRQRPRPWLILMAATAAFGGMISGCLRESHRLGDGPSDAAGNASDVKQNGGSDAGTGGTGGAVPHPVVDGGAAGNAAPPDANPDGATVVSLGDIAGVGWPVQIAPAEIARRLSQLLLRKPPSAALTAAVVASAPRTNQAVGQLTDGLLLGEGSLAGRQAFYRWWLSLDEFATGDRDPALFPAFTPDVRQALIDQTLAFVEDITWRPQGDLATLLTEPAAFVTTATAPWFPGIVVPAGATATRVMLDPTQFAGIITQPAVATIYDYPYRADPSMRGLRVRRTWLCQDLPPVPPGERSGGGPAIGTKTIRQAITEHASPACSPCHGLMDPLGFTFGHLDAVGAYHETEGGLSVDTTGTLWSLSTATSTPAPPITFDGPVGLAALLAKMPEVRTCFADKWLLFVTGQDPNAYSTTISPSTQGPTFEADADYIVKRATIGGRLNLRGTIRAVTETHTFLDP